MELLLENSIFLLISTKSRIPSEFIKLFARHPALVDVEIGLTTVSDSVRKVLEPRAYPVAQRLLNLRRLAEHGVPAGAKMDPLIPELTDTDSSFTSLCNALEEVGVRRAAASYLFLRPTNLNRMNVQVGEWSFQEMAERLYTDRIERFFGRADVRIAATDYKRERLERLRQICASHGIGLKLCRCKNPDVTTELCHPEPPKHPSTLFQEELFE